MSVRNKTLLIMGATLVGLIAVLYVTSRTVLLETLARFERQNTRRNVAQVLAALSGDVTELDRMVGDWAIWDDTYRFIEDNNPEFVNANCVDTGFANLRLNLILFINSSGKIVYGTGFDWNGKKMEPVPEGFAKYLGAQSPLFRPPAPDVGVKGLLLLPRGPMLVAARQILTSEGTGPSRGTLIWGRHLDDEEVARVAERTHLDVAVYRYADPELPADFRAARLDISEESPVLVRLRSLNEVAGYTGLDDIYGKRALLLRVEIPTPIYTAVRYFFLWLVAAGVVFTAVTQLLLERVVLSRVARLSADVSHVGASGDPSVRVSMVGKDELSNLAGRINEMLQRLESSQKELRKINRALRMVNECNQALVRATDERELLDEICRIVVEVGDYRLAWVGYAEEDEAKTVRPVAQAGYEEGYLATVQLTWADTERGRGPVGTAIRTGRPSLARDVPTDPLFAPWRAEATKRGYASAVALPLVAEVRTFGSLAICAATPDAFDPEEVTLLTELANDLAYGITSLRARAEREKAEEALRESEKSFRETADLLPQSAFETDAQGNIVFASRHGLLSTGYTEEDLARGLNIVDLILSEERERVADEIRRTLDGEDLGGIEYAVLRKNGTTFPVLAYVSPIIRGGQPVGLRGIAVDLTEQRQAEAERLRLGRLGALGELASGVAHDFNNVLFGVLGFTDLLRNELTDPRLQRYCDRILQAASDGGEIVRRMQSFYRAHLETRDKKTVDINHMIREALELTRPRWKDRPEAEGIPIEVVTEFGQMGPIEGIPSEIREIFTNLIINAVDAMPSGGRLTLTTRMAGERQVGIWISDTGVGMDEEMKRRCFDAFFTTKGEGGSGLGLSLVHRIVAEHDGTIALESELGVGTTFAITLPMAAQPTDVEKPVAAPVVSAALKLLVIDDEETIREIVRDSLQQMGHTVEVAENGPRGVELFRQAAGAPGRVRDAPGRGHFDVVITDLGMPKMNGLEVAQAVHAHSPTTPIILLTGWSGNFDPAEVARSGFAAILRKPLRIRELAAALSQLYARADDRTPS